jgi:hypothetical protein
MVLDLDELVRRLRSSADAADTGPSDALWIRFGEGRTQKTLEFKTANGNVIVHAYLDRSGALVGLEIFP